MSCNAPLTFVSIREIGEADATEMFPLLSHSSIYRFLDERPPTTPRALRERYRRQIAGRPAWRNWIVIARARPVGFVQATVDHDRADIAWVLHPSARGQGIASQAVRLMVERLKVKEVHASVDARNVPSLRVARRAGLRVVGRRGGDLLLSRVL